MMLVQRRPCFAVDEPLCQGVTVAWWKKQGDEFRNGMRKRNQSPIASLKCGSCSPHRLSWSRAWKCRRVVEIEAELHA